MNQAKADGYDGSLDYVVLSEPKDHAIGLAVQSLLQAVGFEVNLILANNAGDIVQNVYVKHDFDPRTRASECTSRFSISDCSPRPTAPRWRILLDMRTRRWIS
ncbi:hypothetical protein ACETU7_15300 [Rhodococcus sp. 3Y1]